MHELGQRLAEIDLVLEYGVLEQLLDVSSYQKPIAHLGSGACRHRSLRRGRGYVDAQIAVSVASVHTSPRSPAMASCGLALPRPRGAKRDRDGAGSDQRRPGLPGARTRDRDTRRRPSHP